MMVPVRSSDSAEDEADTRCVRCRDRPVRRSCEHRQGLRKGAVWLCDRLPGLDHGVGHALLLLDDAKVPNCQRSKEFKDLGPYPSDASRSMIES
jgi:hypothetical protein